MRLVSAYVGLARARARPVPGQPFRAAASPAPPSRAAPATSSPRKSARGGELGVQLLTQPRLDVAARRRTAACTPTPSSRQRSEILADSEAPGWQGSATTTARRGAMVRIALAPCSPFSVSSHGLMPCTAELAETARRPPAHAHRRRPPGQTWLSLKRSSATSRWAYPEPRGWSACRDLGRALRPPGRRRGAAAGGAGVAPAAAHCPSEQPDPRQNARVRGAAGQPAPVGIGVRRVGIRRLRRQYLWLEEERRMAMLLGKLRHGAAAMTARDALEIATRGGAGSGRAGELGELSVSAAGRPGRVAARRRRARGRARRPGGGAARCGRSPARNHRRPVVVAGEQVHDGLAEMLAAGTRGGGRDAGRRHRLTTRDRLQSLPHGVTL